MATALVAGAPLHPVSPEARPRPFWAWASSIVALLDLRQRPLAWLTAIFSLDSDFPRTCCFTGAACHRTFSPIAPLTENAIHFGMCSRNNCGIASGNFFSVPLAPCTVAFTVPNNSPRSALDSILGARAIAPGRPKAEFAWSVHDTRMSIARFELLVLAECRCAANGCLLCDFPGA